MSNISTIVAAHNATLVQAKVRLVQGKPVWYDAPIIALRRDLESATSGNKAIAVSTLLHARHWELVRAAKAPKPDAKLWFEEGDMYIAGPSAPINVSSLVNWAGCGFGHNARHRRLAGDLSRFGNIPSAAIVEQLGDGELADAVDAAKRYTKQPVLNLILTTRV